MKNGRFTRIHMLLAVILSVILTLGAVAGTAWLVIGRDGLSLVEGYLLIKKDFVGPYEMDDVVNEGLSGMVSGLGDQWSYYLDQEAYTAQMERRNNSYVGIGITVTYENEAGLVIVGVTSGSAGEAAGLTAGDIIVSVDGQSVAGDSRYDGAGLIAGDVGTEVALEVMNAAGETRTVVVTRAEIKTDPVKYQMLDGSIGLVTILNFYSGSADAMMSAVDTLVSEGAVGLIFDLRNDPGGYLDELQSMLDYLLPEGTLFISEDMNGNRTEAVSDASCVDLPMVAVVNENSYSAAEFFAAQLRETLEVPLVGEQTSGKGYSQNTFPLLNGGALGISTKLYFTGGGVSLIGKGLTPDVAVSLDDEDYTAYVEGTLSVEQDAQLQAAISKLQ
ncbi:MAG: peptidase [Oscillospiraceae bacterium]|nr:peptidase [Oscillospiraceae bacterium]